MLKDHQCLSIKTFFTESKPECATNVTNGSMAAYEWLEVRCVSNISRSTELSMSCKNVSGSPIGIPGVTTENSISFYVQAGGSPVLQLSVCTVTVTIRSTPVSQGSLASNRTKDYIYDWTSPRI